MQRGAGGRKPRDWKRSQSQTGALEHQAPSRQGSSLHRLSYG